MRLWHKDLLPILPHMQMIGQWRECCLIGKLLATNGTPNHLLVNKILDYPIEHFATYCYLVKWHMEKYGYSPSISTEFALSDHINKGLVQYVPNDILFDGWHNTRYLWQCISNLEEKYDCGGINDEEWELIDIYVTEHL